MGTPDFSVPVLSALVSHDHEIVAAYSQPPRRSGRGMGERKSPVHQAAEKFDIPVYTPISLKTEEAQITFKSHEADVAVVVAYGLILPEVILNTPPMGCWNGHASLLPRWRGAAPIQRAIMAGDNETGVMIMKMDKGLDTGPVAMVEKVKIEENMTANELHDLLSQTTADLMVRAMAALERNQLTTKLQSLEGITYAEKINKSEAKIDWSKPSSQIHDQIRGLSPFPGAWCEMDLSGKRTRVKILSATKVDEQGVAGEVMDNNLTIACGDGALRLVRLQRAGKSPQKADEFLRGNKIEIGSMVF